MIQTTLDVADAVVGGMRRPEAAEGFYVVSQPRLARGIVPEQTVFTVETAEGKRFRVTITKEEA